MTARKFVQVNVFSHHPLKGNPLAVVVDSEGLNDDDMLAFARWTNLSETTFLLPPQNAGADYRLRIFTPRGELPFAGHPTLGSCAVWLAQQPVPPMRDIVQECAVGLVTIRRSGEQLVFGAPPPRHCGPLDEQTLSQVCSALAIMPAQVVAHQRVGSGSPWQALLLDNRESVLAIAPDYARLGEMTVGVAALTDNPQCQLEVRAFVGETRSEDPVTGSLNAGLAQWLVGHNLLTVPYCAAQGTVLGREGRVSVNADATGELWVGGEVATVITGNVWLP